MKWLRTVVPMVLAGVVGCGGSEEDSFTLVPVKGTITRNGKALAGAKVSFVPDQGNKQSTPGVDETGPEGNYMLKFKNRTGIAPGKYKMIITPGVVMPSGAKVPEEFKDDPMMAEMAAGIGTGHTASKSAAAKKAAEQPDPPSEYNVEVGPKGDVIDQDIKAAAKK